MARQVLFLTHAEVEIDPEIAVPQWRLSAKGRARHEAFARSGSVSAVASIYCSTERKAIEAAAPLGASLGLTPQHRAALGENDRSSTGYLPEAAFEAMADAFFARPDDSIDGWERARDAQRRIVGAIEAIVRSDAASGDIAIVAHGAVGALLRCHLLRREITRAEDQPKGGGCYFMFNADHPAAPTHWARI